MIFEALEKWKELEILYQNTIYTCISWYCKNLQISGKRLLMSAEGVSRDSYIFWTFFR